MRRHKPKARERVLDDAEIRLIWNSAVHPTFDAIVKLLFLTGQRVAKVESMKWSDIDEHGTWSIPKEKNEKGVGGPCQVA